MNLIQDPIIWRGVERLVIACAGVLFGVMGYRLFVLGLQKGKGQLNARSQFFHFVLSGTGPGLFFMAAGAIILLFALFKGGAETRPSKSVTVPASGSVVNEQAGTITSDGEEFQVRVYHIPEVRRLEGIIKKDAGEASAGTGSGEDLLPTSDLQAVVVGQERKIADGNHVGCTDREYFERLVHHAVEKENDAFSEALAAGLRSGECATFKSGDAIYIKDTAIPSGLVEIRRKGETRGYWTILKAVR